MAGIGIKCPLLIKVYQTISSRSGRTVEHGCHCVYQYFRIMEYPKRIIPERIAIYARDVENITGKSERAARRLVQKIRRSLNKNDTQLITVAEFCRYTGLKEEDLERFMRF